MATRFAILPDFREENWPSMDLCDDMLQRFLPSQIGWSVTSLRPRYRPRLARLPIVGKDRRFVNYDRWWNRQRNYPKALRGIANRFDLFHVVDHSYAHLVHCLPISKTGVYCHDLDAFRCLTRPEIEPRPKWFRNMASHILEGLQKAPLVFYSTRAVYDDMIRFQLLDPAKLVHAPYGVDEVFCASDNASTLSPLLAPFGDGPWLMHVGATIPRKRIDVLLNVLSATRKRVPNLKLCKVGADWSAEQLRQIQELNLENAIVHLGKVAIPTLVEAYQRASAVLITSEAEGFGLPVIEAMACGASVIASDIPVLRETGGSGAVFAPVGDIEAWVDCIERVLRCDNSTPSRQARLAWSSQYSWKNHTEIIAKAYQQLL